MDALSLLATNLLSPPVVAFAAGVLSVRLRSELALPESLHSLASLYLLLAIGIKGGASLAATSFGDLVGPLVAALALSLSIPFAVFAVGRKLLHLDTSDAASLAAHYGSVSAVTFLAARNFAVARDLAPEEFLPALLAIMEAPAIIVALVLARRRGGAAADESAGGSWARTLHEVLAGRSVFLLGTGLVIGLVAGAGGYERVAPFFVAPFDGVLVVFLLELGIVAGRTLGRLRRGAPRLVLFGLVAPLVQGPLGVFAGHLAGLSTGGCVLLGVLAGSASYIAAPAAVRLALPKADPGLALALALGVTFPFNLVLGIPLLAALAEWVKA